VWMNEDSRRTKRATIARFSVLTVLFASGAWERLAAEDGALPTGFYIVSVVTSDASPFWYHYVLDVKADGRDSVVRYMRIAPMDSMCAEVTTVKVATARLSGVSPADLIPQGNMCSIDAASINRELRGRVRTAAIDDSVRYGIVATCGSRTVVLRLPFPEQVKLERLRKSAPQLARWWDIQGSVKEKAFGPGQVFYNIAPAQEEVLQQNGQTVVPELLSGAFDIGLPADCATREPCKPSFRDELSRYVGPLGESGRTPKLVQAGQYRFVRYTAPKYPAMAMQARISGTVRLELSVDPNSGEVRDIKVLLGHPIFLSTVMEAVRQWKFVPDELRRKVEHIPVDLVFEWDCPKPLAR
jgi:TonB family protein